jgi:hypothetical protein
MDKESEATLALMDRLHEQLDKEPVDRAMRALFSVLLSGLIGGDGSEPSPSDVKARLCSAIDLCWKGETEIQH